MTSKHNYLARTATGIEAEKVDVAIYGSHVSEVVNEAGIELRLWHFERKDGRDAFLKAVADGKFRRTKV